MSNHVPDDLRFTPEHEWVREEGDIVRVGITAYAQEQLGDVVFVDVPAPGSQIEVGQSFGEVESTKSVSDLYAPVSGTVEERNEQLEDQPDLVNSDPYGAGWLIAIRPSSPDQVAALMDGAAYAQLIAE